MTALTMREAARAILGDSLPETTLSAINGLDNALRGICYAHVKAIYIESAPLFPGAPPASSFGNPFDEFPDRRKPVTEGVAQLLLQAGLKTGSGVIPYDEQNPSIAAKTRELAKEIADLFAPDFDLFNPHAAFEATHQRVVAFLGANKEAFAQNETLQAAMDRVLGKEELQFFRPSPLLPPPSVPAGYRLATTEHCLAIGRDAAQATLSLAETLVKGMIASYTDAQRRDLGALLAERAVLKGEDPASEPFMSDRQAELLGEAIRPGQQVGARLPRPTA